MAISPSISRIMALAAIPLVPIGPLAPTASAAEASVQRQVAAGSLLSRSSGLHVEKVSLAAGLEALARSSGVVLAYSPSRLPATVRVSCACVDLSVADALDALLEGTGFVYREGDGEVILTSKRVTAVAAPTQPSPAQESSNGLAVASEREPSEAAAPSAADVGPALVMAATITGVVTSEGGGAVVGAAVTSVRTGLSALTNAAGAYRIVVPTERIVAGPDTLRIDRLGYTTNRVPYELSDGEIRLDVVLSLEAVALDQIVVTGTAGNQERRAQAAVVATIDAAEVMRDAPIANVSQLLQARVPGISIIETSGTTGAASRINIRGAASINLSNQPLIFLDGIRVDGGARMLVNVSGTGSAGQAPSALNDLNPEDIESIEVVKGPAAATLYGADASAGVIQIITKRGRLGSRSFTQELTFEYDVVDPNFTMPTNYAPCVEALVGATSPNPLCRGREVGTIVSDNPAERIGAFSNGWAGSLKYSARGGGENYAFFASVALANEQGTTPNNLLKQRSGRVNFTFAPTDKLAFDASLAVGRTDYDLPRTDQDSYGYYVQSILGSPLTVGEGADGTLTGGMLFGTSSLESLSAITSRASALRMTPSAEVRYSPVPWFTNRITAGADVTQGRGFVHFPRNDQGWYPSVTSGNSVMSSQDDDRSYTVDYLGNIQSRFGADGEFSSNLSVGSQHIHRISRRLSGEGTGLATNSAILVTNTSSSTVAQSFGESKSLGVFVHEQLGFRDRLFLQLAMRADRNSAFGADVGTFFLPKVGASYVISDESFWEPLASAIPTLRLRAAYGTTGRSPGTGAPLRTFATARYVTDQGLIELGVVPGNPGNTELKPERGREIEIGFDAGFLNDRLGAELTFFDKKSTDVLVSVPVPPSSGFGSSPFINIGEIVNRGVELLVRATPVSGRHLVWEVALNGSTLHNEIMSLGTAGTFLNSFRAFAPGRQVAAFWAHRIREVEEESGMVIVSDTAEFSGNQLPTLQGSLSTTLRLFGNLRVYALFEGKSGYSVYNLNQEFRDRSSRSSAAVNLPGREGGYSTAERLRRLGPYVSESGDPVGAGNVKDPYIQSGDHVRLRELTATFVLPTALVQGVGATGASLTVGGRNLGLWFTDYEGDDPDVLGTGAPATGINQFFNADVFTTPPSRRWVARLNVQF